MRVTSKMMQNTYLKNVNALTGGTQNSLNQLSSGMKLFKASEDTAAAVKAYQVRTSLNRNIGYASNLSHADAVLTNSESALLGIEDVLKEAKAKIIQGMNSPNSKDERKVIAGELESIRNQIFETMNSNDSGFYIFGGSNTDEKPFNIVDGKLSYNGYTLADLDSANADDKKVIDSLVNDELYLDIGLTPEFKADGSVNQNSVFEYSITGINVMGYGTTALTDKHGNVMKNADGTDMTASKNLYDVLGDIITEFRKGTDADTTGMVYDVDRAESLYGVFTDASNTVTFQLTNIGSKTSYIDYSKDRLSTLNLNLTEKQSDIEDVDYAESYTTYTSLFTSYQAALQVGSKVIGPSLFDYLR